MTSEYSTCRYCDEAIDREFDDHDWFHSASGNMWCYSETQSWSFRTTKATPGAMKDALLQEVLINAGKA